MKQSKRIDNTTEEGGAMIVVMLVLLAATALATFAVHTTTSELRAAGHAREGMQAQYLAESGLGAALAVMDQRGPQAFLYAIEQTSADSTLTKPVMMPFEPDLAADKDGYRMYLDDIDAYGGLAVADAEILSESRQVYQPTFIVDINDHYRYTMPIAGHRSDGYGRLQYLQATYTSRGRMRLDPSLGVTDPTDAEGRALHELATDARAQAVTGPFGR